MNILIIGIFALTAYLVGSLPTALWVGQAYFGIDIRQHGSGNSGATNTFRVLGKKPGAFVMLIDIFKGWTATSLTGFLVILDAAPVEYIVPLQLFFGVMAVIGHIFPVYAGFKGGKGVATLLGMVLAIQTEAALICLGVFLVVLFISRYVSLGSMLAALAFPILMLLPWFRPEHSDVLLIVFGFAVFIMIVLTHRKNINRLVRGEESKANLSLKTKR